MMFFIYIVVCVIFFVVSIVLVGCGLYKGYSGIGEFRNVNDF